MEKDKNSDCDNINIFCLVCHKDKIEYMCMPCRCSVLCRKCAMKMATGGKCKICKELFSELRRVQ
jgi:hypothetical protein